MESNKRPNGLRRDIDQWEYELYELSGRAQDEIIRAGLVVREKYDNRISELRSKVDQAKRKLAEEGR